MSSPSSGKTLEIYSENTLLGVNTTTLEDVKFGILYNKKAILCRATLVLPEPAIPSTIRFLSSVFLITLFCSSWMVLTIFFILSEDSSASTSWRRLSLIFKSLSKICFNSAFSIIYCLFLVISPFIIPLGAL